MKTKLRSISPYTDYRTEQVRTGQNRSEQDRTGQNRTDGNKTTH